MAPPGPPSPSLPDPPSAPWRLCALSFVVLTLALALARLLPAEVPAVSRFPSLVPAATLFGLALGSVLQQRRTLGWLFPVGLLLLILFILGTRGSVLPDLAPAARFWLSPEALPRPVIPLPPLPAAGLAFALVALPFIALGQALARTMDRHPRLMACVWCLAGGFAATTLVPLSGVLGLPPWAWIAAVAGLGTAILAGSSRQRIALVAAGLLFLLLGRSPTDARWSPYALIQPHSTPGGVAVLVNARPHQYAFDLASDDEKDRRVQAEVLARWRRPYELFRTAHGRRPETVLVLRAGIGSQVAVALGEGVLRVVAVEVDPVLLELGRTLNPSDPYSDPRVEVVADDARPFLRSPGETFDLVVFEPLALGAPGPPGDPRELPLENPSWTREALEEAGSRLAEGGLLVAYASAPERFLPRIDATLRSVFGRRTRLVVEAPLLFNATLLASRHVDPIRMGIQGEAPVAGRRPGDLPSTDDWPYLSGEPLVVPPLALWILGAAALLVIGVAALACRLQPARGLYAGYLLLGTGVALTAGAASTHLAILFGGTWPVSAVSAAAALLAVLVALALVQRGKAPPSAAAWTGLLVGLVLNYAVPASALLVIGPGGRAAATALLVGVPVFGAALGLALLFRDEPVTGYPLGVGLVGAMAGTLLGHLSVATGARALWLLALGVFALAWLVTATVHPGRRAPGSAR